jgi:hypothetical protein
MSDSKLTNLAGDPKLDHPRAGQAARDKAAKLARDSVARDYVLGSDGGRNVLCRIAAREGIDSALRVAEYLGILVQGFMAEREDRERAVQSNTKNTYLIGPRTIDWADCPEAFDLVINKNLGPSHPSVQDAISRWLENEHPEGLTRTIGPVSREGTGFKQGDGPRYETNKSLCSSRPEVQYNADRDPFADEDPFGTKKVSVSPMQPSDRSEA